MPSFYRAFEDRYRGSRELIKERLKVYHAFIAPLRSLYGECTALDLGCGRGEWLELLLESGFQPLGVDLDDGMLEVCEALQLPVEHCDALKKLKELPDESLAVVSGFHIAEHIPFPDLQVLVAEALRVLKPAGLLILETPNAENLVVGTNNFYLDPTHERPIPHLLLGFLTEYAGFARSKLMRLQEQVGLSQAADVNLTQVLAGVSPDYGIVAQKNGDTSQTSLFDQAFSKEYGVALGALAERYEHGLKCRFMELEGRVEKTVNLAAVLSKYIAHLQGKSASLMDTSNHAISRSGGSDPGTGAVKQFVTNYSGLDLDVLQGEVAAHHLRLQLQEAQHRISNAEVRYQNSELALRDQLARAAKAEGLLVNSQASVEVFQRQLQQVTAELLGMYKEQQVLKSAIDDERQQLTMQHSQTVNLLDVEHARSEALRQQVNEQDVIAQTLLRERDTLANERDFLSEEQEALLQERDSLVRERDALVGEQELLIVERDHALHEVAEVKSVGQKLQGEIQLLRNEVQQRVDHVLALEKRLADAELQSREAVSQVQGLLMHSADLQGQLKQSQARLRESLASAGHLALQAEAHHARVQALLSSMSWRLSSPLRAMSIAARWLLALPVRLLKVTARPFVSGMMATVLARPALRQRVNRRLKRFPRLHAHLRAFAVKRAFLQKDIFDQQNEIVAAVTDAPEVAPATTVEAALVASNQRKASNFDFNDESNIRLFDTFVQMNGGAAHTALAQAHKKIRVFGKSCC